jgi:Tfp pilus assembly protein PilN
MKNIDFLPSRYRERRTARHSHAWRVLVVAAFGAAVGATAVGQYWLKQSVASQVEDVEQQHAMARAKNEQFSLLQRRLKASRAAAELFTYLKHPWPRTQILASLASTLPPEVALNELTISNEILTNAAPGQARRRPRSRRELEEADAQLLPEERDLKQLRQKYGETRTVVQVTGRTSSISSLHKYVARLSDSPLFAQAELTSMEAVDDGDQKQEQMSEFQLQLVVVAAHGQHQALTKDVATRSARRSDG